MRSRNIVKRKVLAVVVVEQDKGMEVVAMSRELLKSLTPISNGGLILIPPGYNTGSGKAGVHNYIQYCLPPLEAL